MPVSCALGQACDLNTQICPGTRGGLLPSAGQLGELQAAPTAEQAEVSPVRPAQGTTLWK